MNDYSMFSRPEFFIAAAVTLCVVAPFLVGLLYWATRNERGGDA